MLEKVKLKRLTPTAKIITRAEDSIGYDIFADEDVTLYGFIEITKESLEAHTVTKSNFARIKTCVSLACPLEYGWFILDRSSLGSKGITVLGGVGEGTYRGEIQVVLANVGPLAYHVKKGDKIGQIVFKQVELPEIEDVGNEELDKTKRGTKGFGELTGK